MRLPRRKGPAGPVHAVRRTGQPGPRSTTSFLTATTLIYAIGAGITAAAGLFYLIGKTSESLGHSSPHIPTDVLPTIIPGHPKVVPLNLRRWVLILRASFRTGIARPLRHSRYARYLCARYNGTSEEMLATGFPWALKTFRVPRPRLPCRHSPIGFERSTGRLNPRRRPYYLWRQQELRVHQTCPPIVPR